VIRPEERFHPISALSTVLFCSSPQTSCLVDQKVTRDTIKKRLTKTEKKFPYSSELQRLEKHTRVLEKVSQHISSQFVSREVPSFFFGANSCPFSLPLFADSSSDERILSKIRVSLFFRVSCQ
jgi:hypothetical protein